MSYSRSSKGQFASKQITYNIVIVLVSLFVVTLVLWLTRHPKTIVEPAHAATVSVTPCTNIAGTYDCTEDDLVVPPNTTWHTEEEWKLEETVNMYAKMYPYASKDVLRTMIEVAKEQGYADVGYMFKLVDCESKFRPGNTNTRGNTPKGSTDRGLWQFSDYWQAKVSNSQAFDVRKSTEIGVKMLKAGQASLWSCSRLIK